MRKDCGKAGEGSPEGGGRIWGWGGVEGDGANREEREGEW